MKDKNIFYKEKRSALVKLMEHLDNIKNSQKVNKSILNELQVDNKNILKELDRINRFLNKKL
tara:strand:+ start:950 stop:1135 length:186 start_codon:yes stop_codon:yes gene_type:complete